MNMTSDISAKAMPTPAPQPAPQPASRSNPVHPRPAIELQDASVVFGSGDKAVTALSPTTLKMERGDFLALVGPSGCGKSTILRLVSNLIQPSSGHVLLGGREAAAKELRIGMAFQNPTMLPWLTIEKNVMLPLKIVEPFKRTFQRDRKGAYPRPRPCAAGAGGPQGFRRALSPGNCRAGCCNAPTCAAR